MSTHPRFIMIGGFLGAGKTTTVSRLAAHYQALGKRVVIVTNDQATDLVDTLLLRSQGFDVGEVAGSCFCCNFNELTRTVESLAAEERPDVVLAEPVGSCTDLVATVIRPLEQVYEQPFDISPYGVIIKPSHGFRILGGPASGHAAGGFSPKAEYIFRKQIEEADFIIVNRIDEISDDDSDRLMAVLDAEYPDVPVVRMSAKTGEGFDTLCEILDAGGVAGRRTMEVDYDLYAEGEAELGWLNCQVHLKCDHAIAIDDYLIDLMRHLQSAFRAESAEIAHLKVIGMSDGAHAVANLVSSANEPVLSLASDAMATRFEVVINARVGIDPDQLAQIVRQSLADLADQNVMATDVATMQHFRPGRPVPTHRITEA